ncbi:MAG: hypothetical protein ACHP7O_09615 [Burkholderiales bacterium]
MSGRSKNMVKKILPAIKLISTELEMQINGKITQIFGDTRKVVMNIVGKCRVRNAEFALPL